MGQFFQNFSSPSDAGFAIVNRNGIFTALVLPPERYCSGVKIDLVNSRLTGIKISLTL